ncbi:unnamed protein product [Protopolystoma xenopodis]|uniref:PDZ domain-containing protein n=1 Tax=Protopolystoma xenopodis TaxID=117903 RepID=A0A3S5FC47_9PLAT|nr:unnamed protein product [Protopolystoma xenopodis]
MYVSNYTAAASVADLLTEWPLARLVTLYKWSGRTQQQFSTAGSPCAVPSDVWRQSRPAARPGRTLSLGHRRRQQSNKLVEPSNKVAGRASSPGLALTSSLTGITDVAGVSGATGPCRGASFGGGSLGFNIVGGEGSEGIFISHVQPDKPAGLSKCVFVGDRLLAVSRGQIACESPTELFVLSIIYAYIFTFKHVKHRLRKL